MRILERERLKRRDPGPLQPVLNRCRGDLHILEFLVSASLKNTAQVALAEVPEAAILEAVYSRYLGGDRERYRQQIATIAAFSQRDLGQTLPANVRVVDTAQPLWLETVVTAS